MSRDNVKPIRKIHLADQQFANQIVGKYGWRIDNGFARGKLQHRIQPKKHDSMTFAKSPIIHLTKVIQPLHIKLIYNYHQLNRIVEYKNIPLLVSSTLSDGQRGVNIDAVTSATTQRTATLFEKVIQTAQAHAERQQLQQVKSQVEHKIFLTRSDNSRGSKSIANSSEQQATAKLVRTTIANTNQESNQTLATANQESNRTVSTASATWANASQSSFSITQPMDGLHHIEKVEAKQLASNRQVVAAKMILSPYMRNIVKEEQERIIAEWVERKQLNRTKATLHGLVHRTITTYTEQTESNLPTLHGTEEVKRLVTLSRTQQAKKLATIDESEEAQKLATLGKLEDAKEPTALGEIREVAPNQHHSIARKAIMNQSTSISLKRWHRKLTIEQMTILRQKKQQLDVHLLGSKVRHVMTRTNLDQHNHLLEKLTKPKLKQSNTVTNSSSQLSLQHIQRKYSRTETNQELQHNSTEHRSRTERQTIINDLKYYLKTTSQHIKSIKHHQKIIQNEQKLVYVPFLNRENTKLNENVKLIYRNLLTQVDTRITNNQHSYKQEVTNSKQSYNERITNNEHSHKHEENIGDPSHIKRQIAIMAGEASKKQQRRIEATTVQIRSVTSFHQQLIERNERLIYQIEMVEKKKTPRARKLSLVPVVKLSYRVLPEEQRKHSARIAQAQLALVKDGQSKGAIDGVSHTYSVEATATSSSPVENRREAELLNRSILQNNSIRRHAQLIYTVNRQHERHINQHTTEQMTQQVSKQISKKITQQQSELITRHLTQQATQQISASNNNNNNNNPAKAQQLPSSANAATNEGRINQVASSTIVSNELITVRPQYNTLSVAGRLTHISKVNKTQLLQVKMLQSKLKQLQAITLVMPRTMPIKATDSINSQSKQSSSIHNDATSTLIDSSAASKSSTDNVQSLSVIQTNYNVNNLESKQLVYRLNSSSSVRQLTTLINELQKTRSQTIQSYANSEASSDISSSMKPLSTALTAMSSIATKRINLIHSSQQQGERLTKRLKQQGGATLLSKVKNMISTQSPLSIVKIKTTNEQELQLVVNEQHSKSKTQNVEQVRRNTQSSTQSSMNLHIAKQQHSMEQHNSKQSDAVKQLEITVKRLEQELSLAKETKAQPTVNVRQLSDQLFDQISRKIKLEQHRNGR